MRISDWSSDVCSSDLHDVLFSFSLSRNVPGKPVWLFSETESPNGTSGIGPPKSKIWRRSEEQTYELQSLMRKSYAVLCLKQKKPGNNNTNIHNKDRTSHYHYITLQSLSIIRSDNQHK